MRVHVRESSGGGCEDVGGEHCASAARIAADDHGGGASRARREVIPVLDRL